MKERLTDGAGEGFEVDRDCRHEEDDGLEERHDHLVRVLFEIVVGLKRGFEVCGWRWDGREAGIG